MTSVINLFFTMKINKIKIYKANTIDIFSSFFDIRILNNGKMISFKIQLIKIKLTFSIFKQSISEI